MTVTSHSFLKNPAVSALAFRASVAPRPMASGLAAPAALPRLRFAGANDPTPDLRAAWRDEEANGRLQRVLREGLFKDAPPLAGSFLSEVEQLSRSGRTLSTDEVYERLARFMCRPENQAVFRRCFGADDSAREERRAGQVLDLLPDGYQPERIADIGCASGGLISRLATKWDLPREHAQGLEVAARPDGWRRNFTYRLYDGLHLPLPADSQDLASLMVVLHHTERPERVLAEAARILKPGGRLIVREVDAPDRSKQLFNDVMDHLYYKVFDQLPGVPNPANHFGVEEWRRRFNLAGLELEQVVYPEPGNPFIPVHFMLRKPERTGSAAQR